MTTATMITLQIAVLIGLYEIAAGLAGLSGRISWSAMLDEFERSPALTFITGFLVFALGGTLVIIHNLWTDALAVIVSLIAWIALAEGLLIMIAPGPLLALSRPLVRSPRLIGAIALLFGAFMLVAGLIGRAGGSTLL